MKGVTYLRVNYVPEAVCTDDGCTWSHRGSGYQREPGREVRSAAQRHVKMTGHEVTVDILDRTFYSAEPDGAS